jgi:hypothetical protein
MTVQEFYDYITKHMTAEEALKKLLEGTLRTYEHLKFDNQEEAVHPTMIIAMAALDMGWSMAIPDGGDDDILKGMTIGTDEYLDELFNDNPDDILPAEEN